MVDSPHLQRLRSRGYRITPQRIAILEALSQARQHLSPGEVLRRARSTLPGLTEPTVYRTLDFLAGEGVILRTFFNGSVMYELAEPHHHLVCRSCGAVAEIDHSVLEALYARLRAETGYVVDDAHLTLTGFCPACRAASEHE